MCLLHLLQEHPTSLTATEVADLLHLVIAFSVPKVGSTPHSMAQLFQLPAAQKLDKDTVLSLLKAATQVKQVSLGYQAQMLQQLQLSTV